VTDDLRFRAARRDEVAALVALLADDALGKLREEPADALPAGYLDAFDAIDADPNHELVVVERGGALAGVLQLSFLPGLSHRGAWRAQIEGVRVASAMRGGGVGRRLFEHAIERARERGCRLVQLTSDKRRADAQRFYASLGFEATHEGLKLRL
jgi:ribosomal protein S18 acetylase RimI-like enzyme